MPIMVNDQEITDDDVFSEMQYHPSDNMEDARNAAAQSLIVRSLMEQEAVRRGLLEQGGEGDAVDQALMQLVESEVSAPEATSEVCKSYYQQNIDRFEAVDAPGRHVPFEQVEDKIRDYLHTRSVREGVRAWVMNLAENARIAGFDLAASL